MARHKEAGIGWRLIWGMLMVALLMGCSRNPDAVSYSTSTSQMSGTVPTAVRALTTANCGNLRIDVIVDGDTSQPLQLGSLACDSSGNFAGTVASTRAIGTHSFALVYYINDPKFSAPVQVATYPSVLATVAAGGSAALEFSLPDTSIDTSGDNITNVDELNLGLNPFVKNTFTLSVDVTGLAAAGLVLNNGSDTLSIDSDGIYSFSTPLLNTDAYNVTVGSQPTGFVCGVANNSGAMGTANVTLSVACAAGEPPKVTVPTVTGLSQAAAQAAIIDGGLVVGTITQDNSATVPAGNVISQTPAGGTGVTAGSAVDLVISSGSANAAPNGQIITPSGDITIVQGASINFAGTGTDPDNNLLSYAWKFGGGATNSTQQSPGAVTFSKAGTYTVTFTVTDSLGLSDPTPATVTVTVLANTAPNGTITSPTGNVTIVEGDTVNFTGSGTDAETSLGQTLSYAWDFGGGAPNSTQQNPGAVTFSKAGTYTVTFTVTDSLGLSDPTPATVTVTVVANTAPNGTIASPTGNVTIVQGDTVGFAGSGTDAETSLGQTLSYAWDFGGGAPNSAQQNPGAVTFTAPGTYTVTFTVTDSLGLSDPTPDTRTVTVQATHTVTTIAVNGTITPSNPTVVDGDTVTFMVKPDSGYLFDPDYVSGCNGSFTAIASYTTGPVVADCTVTATFPLNLGAVSPLYPTSGANWNDYVMGSSSSTASDIACDGAYGSACVHAGELRTVSVIGKNDCAGLTAADDLGAFTWVCDGSTSPVRMVSTGLADHKYLSDLIDFSGQRFKANKVTVYDAAGVWGETPISTAWWTNPVTVNNSGGSLAAPSTIYLVTSNQSTAYSLDADKVALVMAPGVVLSEPPVLAAAPQAAILGSNAYLWIEGVVNAGGGINGIYIPSGLYSVLSNLAVGGANQSGIYLSGGESIRLSDVTANNNGTDGVDLSSGTNNTLSNVTANNNRVDGIGLDAATNSQLSGIAANGNGNDGVNLNVGLNSRLSVITANGNGFDGVYLDAARNSILMGLTVTSNGNAGIDLNVGLNNTLVNVTANNNGGFASCDCTTSDDGIYLYAGKNNTLADVIATNNLSNGIDLNTGLDNRLINVTLANNGNDGLNVNTGATNTLMGLTVTNNAIVGIDLGTSARNTISSVTVANNGYGGVSLNFSANNTLSDLTVVSNGGFGIDLTSATSNVFTGLLNIGNNLDADCTATADAGLDSSCGNTGTSDAVLTTGVTIPDTFVGKVTSDDVTNASDTLGQASFPANPIAFDWIQFDNSYRAWGIDGTTFPNADQRGLWASGTGRIWDWSLHASDTINKGVLSLPSGNDTLTQVWNGTPTTNDNAGCDAMVAGSIWNSAQGVCQTTFLRNAVEIEGDGVGNDNALCESGESCLYTPNIGSYQGHGNLIGTGPFSPGVLTGITLMKYDTNGR